MSILRPGGVAYDRRVPLDSGERSPNRYRLLRRGGLTGDPLGADWWLCLQFTRGEKRPSTDEGRTNRYRIWMADQVLVPVRSGS